MERGRLEGERLARRDLFAAIEVADETFRSAGRAIGAKSRDPGLRFFDCSERGQVAFGPGAGLVVGVSLGSESLRAALVDANGWLYAHHEAESIVGQLGEPRDVILGRIREAVGAVLRRAVENPQLLVDGELPLLGCAVAWPSPLNRNKRQVGQALSHASWGGGQPLDGLVARKLGIEGIASFALNDTHAAALGVAHRLTHQRGAERRDHPELTIVLRVAGGIGGAVIIIEPPARRTAEGRGARRLRGFRDSILLAGFDNHAGEIGHVPLAPSVIAERNKGRPPRLAKLEPHYCSCTRDGPVPPHLEAYASAFAMTRRLNRKRPMHDVLEEVLDAPGEPRHDRALRDVGALVGEALVGPAAMLNPARVVLTGSLAVNEVKQEINDRLGAEHRFGEQPQITTVPERANRYIRAQGAALAVLRERVYRALPEIMPDNRTAMERAVRDLPVRLDRDTVERQFAAGAASSS